MKIAGHVIAFLLALAFLAAGGAKLAAVEMNVQNFERWGYPSWFMYVTGLIEISGAIAIAVPKTRLFGAAILVATMIGATVTHIRAGEGMRSAIPAVALMGLAVVVAAITLRLKKQA